MEFSFYSQPIPIPNQEEVQESSSTTGADDFGSDFDIGDLPVKLELRYAIESRRTERGLDMPVMEEPRRNRPKLTEEEEERRKLRRERNKVAASKCRVKRKQHVKKLLKDSDELIKANSSLEAQIMQLRRDKARLEEALRGHQCLKQIYERQNPARGPA